MATNWDDVIKQSVASGRIKYDTASPKMKARLNRLGLGPAPARIGDIKELDRMAPTPVKKAIPSPSTTIPKYSILEQLARGPLITFEGALKGASAGLIGPGGGLEQAISKLTGGKFKPFQPIQPANTLEKALSIGGELGGSLAPIGAIYKPVKAAVDASKLVKSGSALGRVAKVAVPGAVSNAAYEGARSAFRGDSPAEIAKNTAIGAGLGAVGDTVVAGAIKGGSKALKQISKFRNQPTNILDNLNMTKTEHQLMGVPRAIPERMSGQFGSSKTIPINAVERSVSVAKSPPRNVSTEEIRKHPRFLNDTFSNDTNKLYRETGPDRLDSYFDKYSYDAGYGASPDSIFISKSPELALGQGGNKGIMLQFSDKGVPLKRNIDKPFNPDSGEYLVHAGTRDMRDNQKYLRNNLEKITISKKLLGDVTKEEVETNRSWAISKAALNMRVIPSIKGRGWIDGYDAEGNLILTNPKYSGISATPEEIQSARGGVKSVDDVLRQDVSSDGTVMMHSGPTLDDAKSSVDYAVKNLSDNLGIAEDGVNIITPEMAKNPGVFSWLSSPMQLAKKYPALKPFVDSAIKAVETQEVLRNTFAVRLGRVDDALKESVGGYKEGKALLDEILLTGDMLGKGFTRRELIEQFGADEGVIKAYRLIRSAYDHAHSLSSRARQARGKDPVAYREGYIPHFFHNFFIQVDGEIAGTARTLREAVKISNPAARKGMKVTIIPKQFEFPSGDVQASILGDFSYLKLKDKISNEFSLSTDEAQQLLDGIARMKGRSRFVGNFYQRKGVGGFEKNLDYVHRHYFNMISRYVALDKFKSRSITMFERKFGQFDKEHSGIAGYIRDYINDINGNPTKTEEVLNNTISKIPFAHSFFSKHLGNRYANEIANATTKGVAIAKLGLLNMSSALVNLTQLVNTNAMIGEVWTSRGIKEAARLTSAKRGLLKKMGVDTSMGLESGAGYSKAGLGKAFNASMYLFQKAEDFNRRVSALGAYYKGVSEGMNREQAIEYGRKVLNLTQFEYSIADTPAFIRRSGPIGQILFQFKKFPVKQFEFVKQLEGGKQNARFWLPFLVIGGYYGLPGIELIGSMVKYFTGIDPQLEMKKELMDWAGDDDSKRKVADFIIYGAGSNVGVDISKRVGMGDFIPSEVKDLAGPAVSTISNAIQLSARGAWLDALRSISPAPGNILMALKTDGEIISPWDRERLRIELTPQERAIKAVGFGPVRESIESDIVKTIKYTETRRKDKETSAIDRYIKAIKSGDKEKIREASMKAGELGVTGKRIIDEINRKETTTSQRTMDNIPKKYRGEYMDIQNYGDR